MFDVFAAMVGVGQSAHKPRMNKQIDFFIFHKFVLHECCNVVYVLVENGMCSSAPTTWWTRPTCWWRPLKML